MKAHFLFPIVSLGVCFSFAGYASDPAEGKQPIPVSQLHSDAPTPDTSVPPASQPDTSHLSRRVSSRWDSLIAGDFAQAYTYFSPTYRELFPLERYLMEVGTNVEWKSVDIQEIAMDGNRAEVEILLRYRINLPPHAGFDMEDIGTMGKVIDEVWLWIDGDWWYVKPDSGKL